jgi:hypothetical protein
MHSKAGSKQARINFGRVAGNLDTILLAVLKELFQPAQSSQIKPGD